MKPRRYYIEFHTFLTNKNIIMKKLLFIIFIISLSHTSYAQSSHSIGLNTSYFFQFESYNKHFDTKVRWRKSYQTPQLGLVYNYFVNEKHGIMTELGGSHRKSRFGYPSPLTSITRKDYHIYSSLHYIFKHRQFFVQSGFNARMFNILSFEHTTTTYYQDEIETTRFYTPRAYRRTFSSEYHLALGKEFNCKKFKFRVSGFFNKAFYNDNYFDLGSSIGVFYQLGTQ